MDNFGVGIDTETLPILERYRGAQNHGRSAGDAACLDLALHRGCGLATLDARLAARARDLGIPVHD